MKTAQHIVLRVIGHVFASAFFIAVAAGAFYLFYSDLTGTMSKLNEQPIATVAVKDKLVQRHFADRLVWDQLRTGSAVYNGDVLRTADLSGVSVVFVNKSSLDLGENSMAQVFYTKEGVSVDVAGGVVNATASTEAAAGTEGKIVITSGGQSVSVNKGGAVSTVVKKDGSMNVQVQQGTASVQTADGAVEEVQTGETVTTAVPAAEAAVAAEESAVTDVPAETAAPGPPPQQPSNVQVTPENNAMLTYDWDGAAAPDKQTAPVEFIWENVNYGPGEKTVLQIAEDRRFTKMIHAADTAGAADGDVYADTQAAKALGAGEYWWRVIPQSAAAKAADTADTTGAMSRKFTVVINKPPEPPPPPPPPPREAVRLTLEPVNGELYEGGSMPRLRWSSKEKAAEGFRMIIARENDPKKAADEGRAVWDITTGGTSLSLPALNTGEYWWTVLAASSDGYDISAAAPDAFRVVPMPPLPAANGLEPVRGYRIGREQLRRSRGLRLGWNSVRGANAYVVTVWKDSFERPLIRTNLLHGTSFTIPDLIELLKQEIAAASAQASETTVALVLNWQVEAVSARSNGIIDRPGTPARSSFIVEIQKPPSPQLVIDPVPAEAEPAPPEVTE